MGYVILMRHGKREIDHDSPLVNFNSKSLDNCCPEIWNTIHKLVQYDIKRIITSPYLRTRQTAILVQYGYYKTTGKLLDIVIDKRIGEFLNKRSRWKQPSLEEFDKETLTIYDHKIPLCKESKELMISRVVEFYNSLKDKSLVITHNGIASMIGMFSGKDINLNFAGYDLVNIKDTENVQLYN